MGGVYFRWEEWVDIFYGWMVVGGDIFWVGGDELTIFMGGCGEWWYILGGWGWVDIFY